MTDLRFGFTGFKIDRNELRASRTRFSFLGNGREQAFTFWDFMLILASCGCYDFSLLKLESVSK